MKIGLLVPIDGLNLYGDKYFSIVSYLFKKGHEVVHPLAFTSTTLQTLTQQEIHNSFEDYYTKVKKCDLVLAECSYPCVNIGYEIAHVTQQGKDVIILKAKNSEHSLKNPDPLYTKKNIYIYEYQKYNLHEILEEAISFNPSQKYRKYNILFTPDMIAKLNEIAKKKNLHKSVYIRQLLEKGLETDK